MKYSAMKSLRKQLLLLQQHISFFIKLLPKFKIDDLGVKTIKRKEKKNYQGVVLDCMNNQIESSSDLFPSLLLLREV